MEQLLEKADGAEVGLVDLRIEVEVLVEVLAELDVEGLALGAVLDDGLGLAPDGVGGADAGLLEPELGVEDDVADLAVDEAADGEVAAALVGQETLLAADLGGGVVPDADVAFEAVLVEEAGVDAVVEVVAVVGDLVGEVGDLGFEGGGRGGGGACGMIVGGGMLGKAFADLEGEVQAGERGVFLLEALDDAEALAVVLEPAVVAHELVEGVLTLVAVGGVAEVMSEGDGFGEVLVDAEGAGDVAGDGGDLHGVGEAGPQVVAGAVEEDLGLVFEPAEGARVDDAVAVALVLGSPVGGRLGIAAAARVGAELGEWGEPLALVLLEFVAGAGHGRMGNAAGLRRGATRGRGCPANRTSGG